MFRAHVLKTCRDKLLITFNKTIRECCVGEKSLFVIYEQNVERFGVFVKLRKATINGVMSVCLSVSVRPPARPQRFGSQRTDFHEI